MDDEYRVQIEVHPYGVIPQSTDVFVIGYTNTRKKAEKCAVGVATSYAALGDTPSNFWGETAVTVYEGWRDSVTRETHWHCVFGEVVYRSTLDYRDYLNKKSREAETDGNEK